MNGFADWLTATTEMQEAWQTLQSQFRLSEREMREATDALAPAFMLGLRQMQANQAVFADVAAKFSGQPADKAGMAAMNGLFGPAGLADAVARQASMASGIAPDTLLKMMPALSAMTMDAFLRHAGGTPAQQPLPADSAGVWLAEVMRRSANAMEAFSRPSGQNAAPQPAEAMGRMFSEALKGFPWPFGFPAPGMSAPSGPASSRPASSGSATQAEGKPGAPPSAPLDAAFDMIDKGRAAQAGYWREMMAVFDRHDPTRRSTRRQGPGQ